MSQAVARRDWTPGGGTADLLQWFDRQRQADPNYTLPDGYKVGGDGRVIRDVVDRWGRVGQIGTAAGIGMMAYGAGALAAPYLGSGALGAAGSGGVSGGVSGSIRGGIEDGWGGALRGGVAGGASGALSGGLSGGASPAGVAGDTTNGASGMGWSDALKMIGGTTASGGTDWAGLARTGLGVAGAIAEGRQGQRETDTASTITRDSQGINAQGQNDNARAQAAQIEMQQKEEQRVALNNAYQNAIRSSLAMNMTDVQFNRPEGVASSGMTGGARPSALGAQGRQAAGLMNAKALEMLMAPEKLTPLPMPSPYTLNELPKSNGVDTALGIAGTLGNVLTASQARNDTVNQNSLIRDLLRASQQATTAPAAQPQGLTMPNGQPGFGPENWGSAVRF